MFVLVEEYDLSRWPLVATAIWSPNSGQPKDFQGQCTVMVSDPSLNADLLGWMMLAAWKPQLLKRQPFATWKFRKVLLCTKIFVFAKSACASNFSFRERVGGGWVVPKRSRNSKLKKVNCLEANSTISLHTCQTSSPRTSPTSLKFSKNKIHQLVRRNATTRVSCGFATGRKAVIYKTTRSSLRISKIKF